MTVAALALSLGGCGKDKKEGDNKGGGTPAPAGGGATPEKGGAGASAPKAPVAQPAPSGAKPAFAVFPKDYDVMFGVSADKLRQSKLWQQFSPMIAEKLSQELGDVKTACGVDLMTAFHSVVIGANTADDENALVVVKLSGVDKPTANKCILEMSKKEGKTVEITEDGKLTAYKEGDKTVYTAWLDANTIVAGPKGENNKDWMNERLASSDGLDKNADMMDLLKNVDTSATLWLAMKPAAGAENPFNNFPGGAKPTAVFASILLTSGLKIDAGLRFASADEAKQTADMANQVMEQAKQDPNMGKFVSKATMTATGNDVIVKIDLNEAELNELLQMLQQQLGPMMMMMMGGGGM